MNPQKLKSDVLAQIAEQGIPASYDPWQAVKNHVRKSNTQHSSYTFAPRKTIPLVILGAGILLLTIGFYFFTPPGQVVAQNFFAFFNRADSDQILLENTPAQPTIASTQALNALLTTSAYPDPASVDSADPSDTPGWDISLTSAEELAQFKAIVPADLPDGYQLETVAYDDQNDAILQIYAYTPYQAGEMFVLTQQRTRPTDLVGNSADIETFEIDGTSVESVTGGWWPTSDENMAAWTPLEPERTFRWKQGDDYLTLRYFVGDSFSPAYLDEEAMYAQIQVILGGLQELPQSPNLNQLRDEEEIETVSGKDFLIPTLIPSGFTFTRGVYEPENQRAVLIYSLTATAQTSPGTQIVIFEVLRPLAAEDFDPAKEYKDYPPEALQFITINGNPAVLVQGRLTDSVYDPANGMSLAWQTETLMVTLHFWPADPAADSLSRADLIALTQSMQ